MDCIRLGILLGYGANLTVQIEKLLFTNVVTVLEQAYIYLTHDYFESHVGHIQEIY